MALTVFAAAAMTATAANAQKKYDPGASDTEIKIGNIMPYSGPASAYGVIGKAEAAYFNKINEEENAYIADLDSSAGAPRRIAEALDAARGLALERPSPNNLESSMCKAKAGAAVREITQGCIEILGPMASRASTCSRSGSATCASPTSTRAPARCSA